MARVLLLGERCGVLPLMLRLARGDGEAADRRASFEKRPVDAARVIG
jgi:hypothetical protein